MRTIHLFCLAAMAATTSTEAQVLVGAEGGYDLLQGLGNRARAGLSDMHRSSIGLVLLEGAPGRTSFRTGIALGECSYDLGAADPMSNRWERLTARSIQLRLYADVRWSLSRNYRIYFDLGPVIGAEIRETRSGLSYFRDVDAAYADTLHFTDEVEHGLGIRDVRLRIGLSADLRLHGAWFLLLGAHISPGFTEWARDHAFGTWEEQFAIGIAHAFGRSDLFEQRPWEDHCRSGERDR